MVFLRVGVLHRFYCTFKIHRIPDTQSHVITKVHDLLGQPSYSSRGLTMYVGLYGIFAIVYCERIHY